MLYFSHEGASPHPQARLEPFTDWKAIMNSLFAAAVGAVALTLFAGPATATQPPNMQERAVISEEVGLSVDWDVSAGSGAFEAVVTDASTGNEIADISDFVNNEDVTVSTDGTVTVDAKDALSSSNAQAA